MLKSVMPKATQFAGAPGDMFGDTLVICLTILEQKTGLGRCLVIAFSPTHS